MDTDKVITPREKRTLTVKQQRITDNLEQLLEALPPLIREELVRQNSLDELLEIVLDLGRLPEARYTNKVVELSEDPITIEHIEYVVSRVGSFGKDNRAGIERTLHRISAIRNRNGKIIGLTCRIGRAVYGTIDIIEDVVEQGKSILMLGGPGRGKTTKLREVARVLSDEMKKRVVIVDTSNEIAGDGDIPHPAIGKARRMQVTEPSLQHSVMIEAVENHMPEVIVIDEIGTEQEAFASRTIAERGVQLVATAHGNSLENLLMNPTLSDLVGGIQAVTLSDDEAKRRGTQKTVLERKAPPSFDVVIEIMDVDKLAIHHDVTTTVDHLLRGRQPRPEIRVRNLSGEIEVLQKDEIGETEVAIREIRDKAEDEEELETIRSSVSRRQNLKLTPQPPAIRKEGARTTRVFPYGVNRNRLDRAIVDSHAPAVIARDISDADVVIALKASYRRAPAKIQEGSRRSLPTYIVRSNTYAQIASSLKEIFQVGPLEKGFTDDALRETEDAVRLALDSQEPVELAPQNSYVRKLQHQLVERYDLLSESVGVEPRRRVRILPNP